jgi:hypothetical protein
MPTDWWLMACCSRLIAMPYPLAVIRVGWIRPWLIGVLKLSLRLC